MIQRIQTLYLLLVCVCLGLFLSLHILGLLGESTGYVFSVNSLVTSEGEVVSTNLPMTVLAIISLLLTTAIIFLYKRRILQIRLSIINVILLAGHYGMIAFYYFSYTNKLNATFGSVKIAALMPLIGLILSLMAVRKINKDESLVRSLNRIR